MPNKTIALHTAVETIAALDKRAKSLRRSRNSVINEAIDNLLYPPNGHAPKTTPKKKRQTAIEAGASK